MRGPGDANTKELRKDSVVRGHNDYKSVWTLVIGKELYVEPQESNKHDKYAVAVRKDGETVGHAPHSFSRISWYILNRIGEIRCQIPGVKSDPRRLFLTCLCLVSGVNLRPGVYLSPAF